MGFDVFFRDVLMLVQKNLKVLIRSKASSLIIILGPLLIILLAGLAFDNTNAYSLKVGVYAPSEESIIDSFKQNLNKQFTVVTYFDEESCIDGIKDGDIHTCLVFSENFTLAKPPNNEVRFYVDYSRINLVWTVLNVMTSRIDSKVMELSRNLTGVLLATLERIEKDVGDRRSVIIKLATENDIINKNAANLAADLGDIDLSFDEGAFKTGELQSRMNKVKHWVDTALSLGKEGLQKAASFIDSAGNIAGEGAHDSLVQSVEKISKLKERLSKTKDLSDQEFASFSETINQVVSQIQNTKLQLDKADTSRKVGVRVLTAVRNLLDESLINLMGIQQTFDNIKNAVGSIEIKSPDAITQPIVTTIKPLSAKQTYLNYLFPALIALVLMFTALLIVPTLILLEKNSPALFRNFMAPVKDGCFFIATFITSFIILALQAMIILVITGLFFSSQVTEHLGVVLLILAVAIVFFIFAGMVVGYLFRSEETAILGGISVGFVLIFVSNLIIPVESMPLFISKLAALNPFVIVSELLRKALLFDSSFLWGDILLLSVFSVVVGLFAVLVFLVSKKRSLRGLIKRLAPVVRYVKRRSV